MTRWVLALLLASLALAIGASRIAAGPEKVAWPGNYRDGVLYGTVDRYDIKQFRELYTSAEAVKAVREGKAIPSGTVITMVQYKAQLDGQGNPLKGPDGHFIKGDVAGYALMEKRTGWGAEYAPDLRNGEWEYSAFTADGKFNDKANFKACFQCHKPHARQDYVISLARLAGPLPTGPVAMRTSAHDVNVTGFAFAPNTLTVGPGQSVTWTNRDDSPHQIAFTKTQERSSVLLKGQSHAQAFAAPGTYDYACGLHPSMKGTIEVK